MKFFLKYFFVIFFLYATEKNCHSQNLHIDSLLSVLKTAKEDTNKVMLLYSLGGAYRNISEYENALLYGKQALELAGKLNFQKGMGDASNNIGIVYFSNGNYESSLEFLKKSLEIREHLRDKKNIAMSYNNIGLAYYYSGNYALALENYFKSLKIREELKDKPGIAASCANVALIYNVQGNYEMALENLQKSLKIFEELDAKYDVATTYNEIGMTQRKLKNYSSAIKNYVISLELFLKTGDKQGVANAYNNIGNIDDEEGNLALKSGDKITSEKKFSDAVDNFKKSLKIYEEIGDQSGIAIAYVNIGMIYKSQRKSQMAIEFFNKGMTISEQIGYKDVMKEIYSNLSEVYSQTKNYQEAFRYHRLYSQMKDTLLNEANSRQINEMQTRFETEKKEQQIKLLNAENEKQNAVAAAESRKQKIIIWSVAGGLVLVIVFSIFILNRWRITQRQKKIIELQKKVVDEQRSIAEEQKHLVEEKNKEITDSINYAKRIQRALLASDTLLEKHLPEYFVLFKPKDIVSGDFYWARKTEDRFCLAVADCTGHGVPGAFMSLLNISLLKESVVEKKISQPDLILNEVRKEIIAALNPDGKEEGKDGMDCVMCSFDFANLKLDVSCANNPLWLVRQNEIIEIKPDKQPVGQFIEPKPFTLQTIQLEKGDTIYACSDGYADQFGGPKGKKFKYKQLEELLVSIHEKPMEEQKIILNDTIEKWKGNLEQIDDICIVVVRV